MIVRKLLTLCLLLTATSGYALTSTTTLPKSVNGPSFRYGMVDGIDQRYTQDGTLMTLGDYKSVVFDATALTKFNQRAKDLINALNAFGNQRLGDKFNMGVLKIDTKPEVKYFAPVYARGVTERWTLGFGLPIVNYSNKISMSQQHSNIDFYRQQFSGLSAELDQALNTNLQQAANDVLTGRGYKAIENRKESFVGDAQLVSLFRFFDNDTYSWAYQTDFNLPTGPQFNSDDLTALNVFGRTNFNNKLIFSARANPWLTITPYAGYLLNVPDQVTKRVPTAEDDTLPDASTKTDVQRTIGNTASIGGNLFADLSDQFSFGTGYEYSMKERDQYSGPGNKRYDLLSADTQARIHKVRGQISYSTVKSYLKKSSAIPLIVSLEVTDTIAGMNAERQLIQEMSLMLFF